MKAEKTSTPARSSQPDTARELGALMPSASLKLTGGSEDARADTFIHPARPLFLL